MAIVKNTGIKIKGAKIAIGETLKSSTIKINANSIRRNNKTKKDNNLIGSTLMSEVSKNSLNLDKYFSEIFFSKNVDIKLMILSSMSFNKVLINIKY
ncbi:hypothetical protein [uncultured Methanobrevibacter sp.]|uniref:hypothetical protein n=1 Tax=uncultured Methanobrevibacter sp. TaxID=253161 RepID=UPI0026DEE562|nr:hypothetical protein [uncultured Methanobrevibacter sp.]